MGDAVQTLSASLAVLYARAPRGIMLGLAPVANACAALGHPERRPRILHVAGTNGKGSVSAMLESIVRAGGKRTGLYTSPHLCRFAERIRVDGAPVGDSALEQAVGRALDVKPELTFFECATVAAFLAFAAHDVHTSILEVGLGGRLDATNIIEHPAVTVITRIAFDHMDKLGETLAKIAGEKAGIVKRGAPLVLGDIGGEARAVIVARARELGAPVTFALEDEHARALANAAPLKLAGAHQRENAAVAAAAAKTAGATDDEIARGLASAEWPGRLETIQARDRTWLLDAAHNPDGARSLANHLTSLDAGEANAAERRRRRERVLVFGALADKAWREMLEILAPHATKRVYVAPNGRAPAPPADMIAVAAGELAADVPDALERAAALGDSIVVAGSMYLVGEVRAALLNLPRDPPVAL